MRTLRANGMPAEAMPTGWHRFKNSLSDFLARQKKTMLLKKIEKCEQMFRGDKGSDSQWLKAVNWFSKVLNAENTDNDIKERAVRALGLVMRKRITSEAVSKARETLCEVLPACPLEWRLILEDIVKEEKNPIVQAAALLTYYKINTKMHTISRFRARDEERFVSFFVAACKSFDGKTMKIFEEAIKGYYVRDPAIAEAIADESLTLVLESKNGEKNHTIVFFIRMAGIVGNQKTPEQLREITKVSTNDAEICEACMTALSNLPEEEPSKKPG
ncbi:MAG: hypothetical protein V1492_02680 [Candidatus Micrarchaeota archaeon]